MKNRTLARGTVVTLALLGTAQVSSPARAGGIGDFLSPAFGTDCANRNNGSHASGSTSQGTGTAGGNLAGVPVGSALNQCGGADAPAIQNLMKPCIGLPAKVNAQSVLALVNVGVQDIALPEPQSTCTGASVPTNGDLSEVLKGVPVLSAGGSA